MRKYGTVSPFADVPVDDGFRSVVATGAELAEPMLNIRRLPQNTTLFDLWSRSFLKERWLSLVVC